MNRERYTILERERAAYCRLANPEMSDGELVRYYTIDPTVANEMFEIETTTTSRQRRVDINTASSRVSTSHTLQNLTAPQIAELLNVSAPTAYKAISDRPDIYRKIAHGIYEIRDYKTDRQHDKEKGTK
jgi:predicted DNA-binding transcriptional regulator AlpA